MKRIKKKINVTVIRKQSGLREKSCSYQINNLRIIVDQDQSTEWNSGVDMVFISYEKVFDSGQSISGC